MGPFFPATVPNWEALNFPRFSTFGNFKDNYRNWNRSCVATQAAVVVRGA